MEVLESFSPNIEIYSIDEAFFKFEHSITHEQAVLIRKKVKDWTGITVSIGIGPTKTLAKLANRSAKKKDDGIYFLTQSKQIQEQLKTTPPDDIWGIGRRIAVQLKRKNIYTLKCLCEKKAEWIRKNFGVTLYRTVLELKGTPSIELLEDSDNKKQSIACTRTFEKKTSDLELLQKSIASFAARAAEKLRKQKNRAQFLSLFISTSPFEKPYESKSYHITLSVASSYTPDLITLAKEGLLKIYKKGFLYKKAGVLLGDFVDEDIEQKDFFESDAKNMKKKAASVVFDQINSRFNSRAIRFLAEKKEWRGKRNTTSPKYTPST
jgi:DNA polymerase V